MTEIYRDRQPHNLTGSMLGPLAPFFILWKYRFILWQTTYCDVRTSFAGSVLGIAWLALYPIFLLSAYALVYIVIFKVRFPALGSAEYVALIFCGLIPFLGFAEALSSSIPSLTSNSYLIKNSLFPIELIPVKAVLVSHSKQLVGTAVLVLAIGMMGKLNFSALMLFPIWLLQLMFMVGVAWILSAVNIYLRDIQSLSGLIILFLMMISPIAYTPEMVPENLRHALGLNPLYYIIIPWQDVLIHGTFPRGQTLVVLAFMAWCLFLGGFWFFSRLRSGLVDNV